MGFTVVLGHSHRRVLFVFLSGTTASSNFVQRKEELAAWHPLFGRKIERDELPVLDEKIQVAWALPFGRSMSIAYLIQGEEDTSTKEEAMWGDDADVFVLTFRTQRASALFFPDSLLAEGRNVLLSAAAIAEIHRGFRYTYYVFMDGDVEVSKQTHWSHMVFRFEAFLKDWEPAIGVPAYSDSPTTLHGGEDPMAIFHFDHIFIAVHAEAAPTLLPYDTSYDGNCSWVSQWKFTLLSSALFPNHTLVYPSVRVFNPGHSVYPRSDCEGYFAETSAQLRALVPSDAADCFPTLPANGHLFDRGMMAPVSYIPWGTPKRKRNSSSIVNYHTPKLNTLESCKTQYALYQENALPRIADYCPGCSNAVAMHVLQVETAQNLLWAPNWHELSAMIWGIHNDVPVAVVCNAIAKRLLQLRGHPFLEVEESGELLAWHLAEMAGAAWAAEFTMVVKKGWLWVERSEFNQYLENFIQMALTSHRDVDAKDPVLISQDSLRWFIDILSGNVELLDARPQGRSLNFGLTRI